jgi:hypothetical protein
MSGRRAVVQEVERLGMAFGAIAASEPARRIVDGRRRVAQRRQITSLFVLQCEHLI